MNNLIEILPNIYGVKVPIKSSNHHIAGGKLIIEKSKDNWESFMFLDGNYKILGTLTKDEISFDASDIVDKKEIIVFDFVGGASGNVCYKDYKYKCFDISSSEESFRSALPEDIKENEKLLILQKL